MSRTLGRVAAAIYLLALRAFPRDQREVYATEMTDTFARELAARQPDGQWRVLRFVVAAWLDGVRAGLGERQYQRRKRRDLRQGEAMRRRGIFTLALVLVGSGVAAGNLVLMLIIASSDEVELSAMWGALVMTSTVMLTVGLLACVEPARRALRIHPTDALKDA